MLPYPSCEVERSEIPSLITVRLASNFELATAETFALLKRKRPPPLAYPFPNRQCIERTTRGSRPLAELGTVWVAKPFAAITRDVSGTPRSPWEPRLYGGVFGVSNAKLQMLYGELAAPKSPSNLLYCCAWPAFRHQYVATLNNPPLGTKSPERRPTRAEVRTHRARNRSMVMTDFPSPSDRSKTAKSLAFALFRPVLFAVGVIALALGGLVLTHRSNPEIAALPAPRRPRRRPAAVACRHRAGRSRARAADHAPASELVAIKGFQMKPPEPAAEPEPPASDRYELTLRLERGDTIEKMLADIDVPEADRKQIAEKLHGASQEEEAGGRRDDRASACRPARAADAPRVLSLSVRPQPEREYIITRQDDGTYDGEEKIYKVSPRIVRVEGERNGSLAAERHEGGRAVGGDGRVHPRALLRRRLPARAEGRPEIHRAARAARDQRRPRHPSRPPAGGRAAPAEAHGDGDPLPAARWRRRLLQSPGRERRALLPAHADGCLEDHLALRHARASDPGLQRAARRRRLRRAHRARRSWPPAPARWRWPAPTAATAST